MSEVLLKNYLAGAAIEPYRIVKMGSADRTVIQAAAATDSLVGVSTELPADSGERVDVVRVGMPLVEFGGTVTRGDPLTSDTDGKAIKAAPAAGARMSIIGFAEVSAVAGDIEAMSLAPGFMTTPA